ncbi:TPA: hypothetical protein DCZ39_01290 [Patescibacteria group bacterium]|nr:hypothetical protein [Candidatus Gracilibacteria bacterium]
MVRLNSNGAIDPGFNM